ncbi:YdaS family helix-turn-helix protein [uncultured Deefgea sp.]|uniref:transcriptional regulator n=1 Tax=uncultured Deefgea sp. TaxID=1304914 RepID=UPI00260A3EBB|nr:YdaS family helix-turn-helix protein [uncultured Deefgea sp.]
MMITFWYCSAMDIKSYISIEKSRAAVLADAIGSTVAYIKHLAAGRKRCGESLAIEIEKYTHGEIRCEELRPDVDWAYLRGTAKTIATVSSSVPSA